MPGGSFAWTNFPSTIDTCTSPKLNWDYSGPREMFLFLLIPDALPHIPGMISRKRVVETITLATDVDVSAAAWTWPRVNITAGQYVVEAHGRDFAVASPRFVIADGADASCLAAGIIMASSIATLSATSTTPPPQLFVPRAELSGDGSTGVIAIAASMF
ncbi:hypothetical protein V8D89_004532 [Ganoderma adspersum]